MVYKSGSESLPRLLVKAVAFAGFLSLVPFFLSSFSCSGHETPANPAANRSVPLQVNLREQPIYLKRGFDYASLLSLPDISGQQSGAEAPEWVVVEPTAENKNAPLLMRGKWPDIPRRHFLSPRGEKSEEFTLLIPFDLSREELGRLQIDSRNFPGIFFSGLGDNWAVFLNGVEIRSEVHLNDAGHIVSHRRWRQVYFPLNKTEFVAGTNILGLRIIGAPNSENTGFFYGGPYYIGDYLDIERQKNETALIAFCSIYLFVGIYQLLIWMGRRKERYNFFYGLFTLFLGLYIFTKSRSIYAFIPESNILHRIEYALLFLLVPIISAFFEELSFRKLGWVTKIYGFFCVICVSTEFFFSIQYADNVLRVWQPVSFFVVIYLFGHNVVYAFSSTVRKRWERSGKKTTLFRMGLQSLLVLPLGNIMIGVALMFAMALFDMFDSFFFHTGSSVSTYGFLVFVIGATLTLIRRFHYLNRALEQSKTNLEEKVRERTEELEAQTQIAKRASLAKSDFLANMSHEIRTPMNAIMGMVELILRKDISTDIYEDALGIKRAGVNLLAIINDILDFSKIESGKMELVVANYRLDSLINDCISIARVRLTEKPLLFIVDVDSTLPSELRGDEIRIRQIIINLLANAVKFTQNGYIALKVSATAPAQASDKTVVLKFTVEDTGVGIKTEDMDKLFSDFVRFDSHRNRGIEGTGLGLAISRQLSRLMGGDITVLSVYGEGSSFTATLSQEIKNPAPIAIVDQPADKFSLVLESRPVLARSFSYSLQNLGIPVQVLTATDAFFRELEKPVTGRMYPFVFVPGPLAEKTAEYIKERKISTCLIAVLDLGDPVPAGNRRTLSLPVYTVSLANAFNGPEEERHREKSHIKFTAPDARILVVDDNRTNLVVVKGLLSPYRMDITLCNTGREAIALARQNRYDIIFMDHMMPGMDGVEATAAIRAFEGDWFREVPIVALTANAVVGMKEEYLSKGFSDFVSKPIEIPKLEEVIDRWVPEEKRRQDLSGADHAGA
jgi:signal transduction histidine kinase/CheY-like chemotaxis protein